MLFITGDCDKDYSRFSIENFPQQKGMTKDDCVIVCGNLGAVWYENDDVRKEKEEQDLEWLANLPFTILFIDGSCDNLDELNKYPIKEWNGGRVHEIRPTVLHLIRGEIFEICGKKIFAFGGIDYHGIADEYFDWDEDGKWLEEVKKCEEKGLGYCIRLKDQKPHSTISVVDRENAINNLERHNHKVDYFVTFAEDYLSFWAYVVTEWDVLMGTAALPSPLNEFLSYIKKNTELDKWYMGFRHRDLDCPENRYIYRDIEQLA